ncbi:HEAT repeat domain-containing protein [Candidatus Methanocrinis natronophilus]|uniref:HEAT repeat domain-containing protein n=1 Tax=Candidatus Methanocrinis natronophilus TaxID=3033396 RepID=A0ABT5X927_9EURY|nr:HEAT repeat domain-containing protein [Candidatus Methanocrinis natronophilus]MDF0591209.1 HEAT repeat domain-containing protein [Candidatus Methanocrinis natronophilus]
MSLKLILAAMVVIAAVAIPATADEVDDLILDLKYGQPDVQKNAAKALGETGDPRAVEPLIVALKDSNRDLRIHSAYALGEIGDLRAVDPLIAALNDDHSSVRGYAAHALGQIGDPKAVDPLIAALNDRQPNVRIHSAGSLVRLGKPEYFDQVMEGVTNQNSGIREAAAEALGNTRDPRSIEPLNYLVANDRNSGVRQAAAKALQKLMVFASTPVDGQITSVVWPELRNYNYDEAVAVTVNFRNTGSQPHSFWVGYSVQDANGKWWDALHQQTASIQPGQSWSVQLEWNPPNIAPGGGYASAVTLWSGYNSDTGFLVGEIDRKTKASAFWLLSSSDASTLPPETG